MIQLGESSGIEIGTQGLGKKPSGDNSHRKLASEIMRRAIIDLMSPTLRDDANDFFYSSEIDIWCAWLELDVGCVRGALEDLGMLSRSVETISNISPMDMMESYLELYDLSGDSNPEILLELSLKRRIPYAVVHHYFYDLILVRNKRTGWKRHEVGKKFFDAWVSRTAMYRGKGMTTRFQRVLATFREKLVEMNCGAGS